MAREIQKLRRLARKWGGDLVKVGDKEWGAIKEERLTNRTHPFYEANFTHLDLGVHWPTRRIIYRGEVLWAEVIHEMGHTFATENDPDSTDEWEWFGWEYALVQLIGGNVEEWVKHNKDYQISEHGGDLFGDLRPRTREKVLAERVAHGKEIGIIDARGRPRAVPRSFDMGLIQVTLRMRSQEFQNRAKKAREGSPANGNEFERRCEAAGFSEGYDQAVEDVIKMLYAMTVSPAAPVSKA